MKFLLIFTALTFFGFAAVAQKSHDAVDFRSAIRSISEENLDNYQKCQKIWNILWPAAKEGSLEARSALFTYSFPVSAHAPVLLLPGSQDKLSSRRNTIILAIHSIGAHDERKEFKEEYEKLSDMIFKTYLNDGFEGTAFLECLNSQPKKDCAEGATKNLIPNFEKFSAEIDAFISEGMRPKCAF